MTTQPGIGQALAELVKRLTPEEKREFARALSWEELEVLRRQRPVPGLAGGMIAHPARRLGEPRVYVGTTSDGLALELPVEYVAAFVKRLPTLLSVTSVGVYLRRNGEGEEHQVSSEEFAGFLDTHQDVLLGGNLMIELGSATLVSGGGGCMLLTLEEISGAIRRRLGAEALRVCGFDHEFFGDSFTAEVWDNELEVTDR